MTTVISGYELTKEPPPLQTPPSSPSMPPKSKIGATTFSEVYHGSFIDEKGMLHVKQPNGTWEVFDPKANKSAVPTAGLPRINLSKKVGPSFSNVYGSVKKRRGSRRSSRRNMRKRSTRSRR